MDRVIYQRMNVQEKEHWWFVGRRAIIRNLIKNDVALPSAARILEAGCGTGGNLSLLSEFGSLDAFEYDTEALEIAQAKNMAKVRQGELPGKIDVPDNTYDLIAMLDVLEHVEQDIASLQALGSKLSDTGRILLTVPAMPWLWSAHDVIHHHKRRYTRASLRAAIDTAGLQTESIGYFNTFLFPLAIAQRALQRLTKHDKPSDEMPGATLNNLLATIFRSERHLVGKVPLPFGLSIFAIAKSSR